MRKADYFLLAKKLRADIEAPLRLLSNGTVPSDTWKRVESDSLYATQLARYLGEHLQLPKNDRAAFLNLCGLRALI